MAKIKTFQKIPNVRGNYTKQELSDIVDNFIKAGNRDEGFVLYELWILEHMNSYDSVYIDEFEWVLI